MLIYNLFVLTVAFLLYLDYMVHKNDVHLVNGGTRLSFGNTFMYLALVVIIFFAGFRFEIGYDFITYRGIYLYESELNRFEPLFGLLVRFTQYVNFGLDMQMMFLFYSMLITLILYKALRILTPHYRLGILFYLLIPSLYLNSFSVIRQGIAIAVILYGFQYITNNRPDYKKYIFFAFIAFLFHTGSLFVSLIYLIGSSFFQRLYSWVFYGFMILLSFILSFAHIGKQALYLMPGHFSLYAALENDVSPLKLLVINGFFLFFMVQKDMFIKSRLEKYLFNSVFIGLMIFNIFSSFVFVSRLAQYFLLAEIVLVPIYLYSIKSNFNRKIMLGMFLVYYIFNFNYALYRDINFPGKREHFLIPYENYFFEEKKSNRNVTLDAWHDFILENSNKEEEEIRP